MIFISNKNLLGPKIIENLKYQRINEIFSSKNVL